MINPHDPVNTDQLSLFGEDDRKYQKEQSRKLAPKEKPPEPLPEGSCCANCDNWRQPEKRGEFGVCVALCIVTDVESRRGPEKGVVLRVDSAFQEPSIGWEYLRTREGYGAAVEDFTACRLFVESREEQEAA
jgi:hypothetical protein